METQNVKDAVNMSRDTVVAVGVAGLVVAAVGLAIGYARKQWQLWDLEIKETVRKNELAAKQEAAAAASTKPKP